MEISINILIISCAIIFIIISVLFSFIIYYKRKCLFLNKKYNTFELRDNLHFKALEKLYQSWGAYKSNIKQQENEY